jgi:inner membrane protein
LSILPILLSGGLLLFSRLIGRVRPDRPPEPVPKQLLLLSSIAILSHPILDTLNTYGVRWLMPFSGRWFYGDALFIIDPWLWLALGSGLIWSWRRRRRKMASSTAPARFALGVVGLYMGSMWLSSVAARRLIAQEIGALSHRPVGQVMAGPVPLEVLTRDYVVQQDGSYQVGSFGWLARPHIDPETVRSFPRGRPRHPAFAVAETTQVMRRFLRWARFPTFQVQAAGANQYLVHAVDLRYARRPGEDFGTISVAVSLAPAAD